METERTIEDMRDKNVTKEEEQVMETETGEMVIDANTKDATIDVVVTTEEEVMIEEEVLRTETELIYHKNQFQIEDLMSLTLEISLLVLLNQNLKISLANTVKSQM